MKYFFFSVFFIIFIIFVVIYIKISNFPVSEKKEKIEVKQEKKSEKSILKALNLNKNRIILPAKELYLRVDLNYIPKTKTTILYQMILKKLNKYTLFGVEQILKLNNIRYSIIKTKNNLQIFVNFAKKEKAKYVLELFKSYNFNVKLREIKK